eukprot:95466-Hanusia_phi.AAC.2
MNNTADCNRQIIFNNKIPWFHSLYEKSFQASAVQFVNRHADFFRWSKNKFIRNYKDKIAASKYAYALDTSHIAYYLAQLCMHACLLFMGITEDRIVQVVEDNITSTDEALVLASQLFPRYFSLFNRLNYHWNMHLMDSYLYPNATDQYDLTNAKQLACDLTNTLLEKIWLINFQSITNYPCPARGGEEK